MATDERIRWWWRLCEWWGHAPSPLGGISGDGWRWARCERCRRMVRSTREHPRWTAHPLEG